MTVRWLGEIWIRAAGVIGGSAGAWRSADFLFTPLMVVDWTELQMFPSNRLTGQQRRRFHSESQQRDSFLSCQVSLAECQQLNGSERSCDQSAGSCDDDDDDEASVHQSVVWELVSVSVGGLSSASCECCYITLLYWQEVTQSADEHDHIQW